ncbi:MAG: alcohol dehydrogenase catalytic domain-containing protein [Anaerolineae bacterium]|nr:alcohol dehydrogenase catalytic domain-containing protein [Anaerolineae bacterium]
MQAIRFTVNVPRYILGRALGKLYGPIFWSGLSCTYADDVPEPELPGDQWVKIRTRYGGICGTDTSTIHLKTSPYYSPFSSSPFTLGHENVGVITEVGPGVDGWQVGQRIIAEPTLWCAPRGFDEGDWCRYCARGEVNQCVRLIEGDLAPGLAIGACRDTGGSWSASFTAHQSQLYAVPDRVSDENALLVEPFACGLHAVLQHPPTDDETILIIGAGTIGLVQLAALRALGSRAEIIVSARYPFQAEAARKLGATHVISAGDLFAQVAQLTGASLHKPIIGKRVLLGGVDRTYECVGTGAAIDDALRLTRTGGQIVIVGVPGVVNGLDLTPLFDKELQLNTSYIYHHAESYQGQTRRTYDIALEMMASGAVDLGWLVTHRYSLDEYSHAFKQIGNHQKNAIIKGVFEFGEAL